MITLIRVFCSRQPWKTVVLSSPLNKFLVMLEPCLRMKVISKVQLKILELVLCLVMPNFSINIVF